jgi:hypothetical protein
MNVFNLFNNQAVPSELLVRDTTPESLMLLNSSPHRTKNVVKSPILVIKGQASEGESMLDSKFINKLSASSRTNETNLVLIPNL